MRSSLLKLVVLTSVLTLSGSAFAQASQPAAPSTTEPDEASKKSAREEGAAGQRALDEGRYPEAEAHFKTALGIYSTPPTLWLGLARAQLKQNKYLAATEAYERILRARAEDTPTTPKPFKDAFASAAVELADAQKVMPRIIITVAGAKAPVVSLDGTVIPSAALGLKRAIDPGSHTIKVSADGMKTQEKALIIELGSTAEEKFVLEKDPNANSGLASATPVGTTRPSEGPNRTPAYIAFGVGGAGLVVGTVTGLMAMGKRTTLNETCPDGKCPQDQKSNLDGYKTLGGVSTVGFVVGLVGVAAGGILLVIPKKETTKAAYVSPYLGLGGVGATGQF